MKQLIKQLSVLTLSLLMVFSLSACGGSSGSKQGNTIRIVHKNFTEQRLIGEMMGVYLENKGYKTKVGELGGSLLCFNAINGDQADIYAEYTGTGYGSILKQTDVLSAEETYDYVKKEFEDQYNITWLKPMGFNNTYVLSVTENIADEYGVKTISDLNPYATDWLLGGDSEFPVRKDGYPGFQETYGFSFKDYKTMDQGLTYQALLDGELDINVSYATDGRISKFGLVNLEDDKNTFPPYYCTPIIRMDFAETNPDVVDALNELENQFSDEDMQKYNLMVDEGSDPHEVATQMLTDKGLI